LAQHAEAPKGWAGWRTHLVDEEVEEALIDLLTQAVPVAIQHVYTATHVYRRGRRGQHVHDNASS
jgi:hypothetical protein